MAETAYLVDGRKWQISTTGGAEPQWSRDGKEIFYVRRATVTDLRMMAVALKLSPTVQPSAPQELFSFAGGSQTEGGELYAASSDGQRFLFLDSQREIAPAPITILFNWAAALQK